MNSLFDEFRTICSHLNQVGITPTLMGSLGFEYRSNEEWGPSDIDIHVPGDPRGWEAPDHRLNNFPAQLSGGEQQRVSIARAVAKNPKILLCDEPTGALDYQTGKQVLKILQDMSRQKGATVIIVTHNSALAPIADRVIHMRDATVKSVTINEHPQDIDTLEY